MVGGTAAGATGGAGGGSEDGQTKVMDESNAAEDDEAAMLSSSISSGVVLPTLQAPAGRGADTAHAPPTASQQPSASAALPLQPRQQQQQQQEQQQQQQEASSSPSSSSPLPLLKLPMDGGGTGGRGRPYPEDTIEARRPQIEAAFARLTAASGRKGLVASDLAEVTASLFRLPGFLHLVLFDRIWELYGREEQEAAAKAADDAAGAG